MADYEGSPWPDGIVDIPLQDDLELDTHEAERPDGGREYEAYDAATSQQLAAMTLRPAGNGGQEVAALDTAVDPSFAATAVHRLVTRGFFPAFSGMDETSSSFLAMERDLAARNNGTLRALYDFAFARDGQLVIPMPNQVKLAEFEELEDPAKRWTLPEDFTGIFIYSDPENPRISMEDFFRDARFVGRMVEVLDEDFMYAPKVSASDADGKPVELSNPDLHGTQRWVHFLKTLAEGEPELADLIVAG